MNISTRQGEFITALHLLTRFARLTTSHHFPFVLVFPATHLQPSRAGKKMQKSRRSDNSQRDAGTRCIKAICALTWRRAESCQQALANSTGNARHLSKSPLGAEESMVETCCSCSELAYVSHSAWSEKWCSGPAWKHLMRDSS